jgi:hypothetical protein
LPTLDDATPNSGIIVFAGLTGEPLTIDVIRTPFGLEAEEVFRTSLRVEVLGDGGLPTGASFRVVHPVLLLESRVHNVMGLPGGDTPRGRKQLRAMVVCAREFLRDRLDEGLVRPVLDLNERIGRFCLRDHHGRAVYARAGIDPFEAVLVDERLPEEFRTSPRCAGNPRRWEIQGGLRVVLEFQGDMPHPCSTPHLAAIRAIRRHPGSTRPCGRVHRCGETQPN